jgi:hypothetical protein
LQKLSKLDLELLLSKIKVYRNSYNVLTENGWKNVKSILTDDILLSSINSDNKSFIGTFNCFMSNYFVLDIDNHNNNVNINEKYYKIFNVFGEPSLVYKSPRGLHIYYFLKELYSIDLIKKEVKKYFSDIEVKPTSDSALRILNYKNILNPLTLKKTKRNFRSYINHSMVYNVQEIFFSLQKEEFKIQNKKEKIDIIYSGKTNDALNYLIPIWKTQGYSTKECAEKFIAKLDPSYQGECRNRQRLEKRIEYYKVKESAKEIVSDSYEIEQKYDKIIKTILNISDKKLPKTSEYNRELRKKKIKDVVLYILSSYDMTQVILNNPRLLMEISCLYPYFFHETKNGNIPLPSKYFKSMYSNYHKAFNFLYSIGFIKRPHGRSYSTDKHSCQYYRIDLNIHNRYSEYNYTLLLDNNYVKNLVKNLYIKCINFVYDPVCFNNLFKVLKLPFFNGIICFKMFIHQINKLTFKKIKNANYKFVFNTC